VLHWRCLVATHTRCDGREDAPAFAVFKPSIDDYASRLREFADMMQTASVPVGIAICSRDDMLALVAEAKIEAEDSGQEATHGVDPAHRQLTDRLRAGFCLATASF